MARTTFPTIRLLEWTGGNRVRLFFATGKVSEVALPVRSAEGAYVVLGGVGLDPGDRRELSADTVHEMSGKVYREAYGQRGARRSRAPTARRPPREKKRVQ